MALGCIIVRSVSLLPRLWTRERIRVGTQGVASLRFLEHCLATGQSSSGLTALMDGRMVRGTWEGGACFGSFYGGPAVSQSRSLEFRKLSLTVCSLICCKVFEVQFAVYRLLRGVLCVQALAQA
jgi:hypothetical protein